MKEPVEEKNVPGELARPSPAVSSSLASVAEDCGSSFGFFVDLVAKESLVCWVGAGFEPLGCPKNLLK